MEKHNSVWIELGEFVSTARRARSTQAHGGTFSDTSRHQICSFVMQ